MGRETKTRFPWCHHLQWKQQQSLGPPAPITYTVMWYQIISILQLKPRSEISAWDNSGYLQWSVPLLQSVLGFWCSCDCPTRTASTPSPQPPPGPAHWDCSFTRAKINEKQDSMTNFTCKSKHSIHLQWRFPKITHTHGSSARGSSRKVTLHKHIPGW